jgi:hypothetical protein
MARLRAPEYCYHYYFILSGENCRGTVIRIHIPDSQTIVIFEELLLVDYLFVSA